MSAPSDKAVDAARKKVVGYGEHGGEEWHAEYEADAALRAAHDPALGLDRSVCLRDVVEALRGYRPETAHDTIRTLAFTLAADLIEREFGG